MVPFTLHDALKPWYAATDIGTLRQTNSGSSLGRIIDDQAAEFTAKIAVVNSNTFLAAWARVSGDISSVTNPAQVSPHLEIVTARFIRNTGTWSTPTQLTTNSVVDRDPLPVIYGTNQGILWIQNEADASIGNSTNGDRLIFSKWNGAGWNAPQTLWTALKGILQFAFVADGSGQGHAVFAVDEDGNLDTRTNRELYRLSTTNGVWPAAVRLTSDSVEDAMPVLVAPNGVPLCVWSASNTVTYSSLNVWNPRPVFSEHTLANQAPTLDGVTMPGGAAVAYAVQGSNGVDMVASFYDANLDRWSLPRQLTEDEDAESALALAWDGTNAVIAYLKTQTLRTNVDVVINGQTNHLQNVPQPGRTDLCLLRYKLGGDVSVVTDSLIFNPTNAAPGSNVTITVTIENQGDLPVQNITVVFYDDDPANGGTQIGSVQTIAGPLVGGAKQDVTVSWVVPSYPNAHTIFVVVDPGLTLSDRDRSNNTMFKRTVLSDLAIETCWNTEVSGSAVALVARVVSRGVITAGPCEVSWRLGAADGEEIGRSGVDALAPGQAYEVSYLWHTSGRQFSGAFVTVFAVVDAGGVIQEADETNNSYPQSVRVVPAWIPRITGMSVSAVGTATVTFEATGFTTTNLAVESTGLLASTNQWRAETNATITPVAAGTFEAQIPVQGAVRFYRVRATP